MAEPKLITSTIGDEQFPVNENEFYPLVETIAYQSIKGVKSANRIEDAFYFVDLTEDNGVVLETALIQKAESQSYDKNTCDMSPLDPTVVARYFNNWVSCRYKCTVRRDDIRKILANKGQGVEDIVAEILDSLTQGRDGKEFKSGRSLILDTDLVDYSVTLGGTPANLRGVIYAIRDMYDTLRTDNSGFDITGWETHTPEEDIRIAISSKLLNLLGVGELANILHLSEVELWGKLVVIPVSDLDRAQWFKVVVYDRKAMLHSRRKNTMDNEKCAGSEYWNYYLFVDDLFAYNPLFKATSMDFKHIAEEELAKLIIPFTREQTAASVKGNTAILTNLKAAKA